MRNSRALLMLSLVLGGGCSKAPEPPDSPSQAVAGPRENPTPPQSEAEVLSEVVQLTHSFQRAGEAYFSPDMKWIIFQASTRPDESYQMYVAQLKWEGERIAGLFTPIRISPEGSWNSCGYF